MRVTSLGFRTDLMVRRLAGSIIEERDDHLVVRTPRIPTYWWGNFMLLARPTRPGDAERIRATYRHSFPDAANRAIGIDGTHGEAGDPATITELDLEVIISNVLTADAISLRGDAEAPGVRRLATDTDWAQLAAVREAWQGPAANEGERQYRMQRLVEARELVQHGAAAWFGAFDTDTLVAALGIVSDGTGTARYQDVETHPDHRRRGHARRLLQAAAGYAHDNLAATQLVIVADEGYHAIDLYRSLGFTDREQQVLLQGRTAPM